MGSGVLCAWPGTDCRPTALRRLAGRPQLKRDPLGGTDSEQFVEICWGSATMPLEVLVSMLFSSFLKLAPLLILGSAGAIFLSRSTLGKALVQRIRQGSLKGEEVAALAAQLEEVRHELGEIQERLVLTVVYSRRGPMIFVPYAALLAALTLLLSKFGQLPYASRFAAACAAFAIATVPVYVAVGVLGKRQRERLRREGRLSAEPPPAGFALWGHAWRIGL